MIVTRVSLMALIGAALPILVAQGVAWMTVPSAEHPPQ